jgi:hypothetical protein
MPTKAKRTLKRQSRASNRSNKRVKKHRDKLRAAGLKPIQLWVWDTSQPGFAEQVRRECELINASTDSERVMDEMLSISDFSGWR